MEKKDYEKIKQIKQRVDKSEKTTFSERNILAIHQKKVEKKKFSPENRTSAMHFNKITNHSRPGRKAVAKMVKRFFNDEYSTMPLPLSL